MWTSLGRPDSAGLGGWEQQGPVCPPGSAGSLCLLDLAEAVLDHGDLGKAKGEKTSMKWPHCESDVGGSLVREAESARPGQRKHSRRPVSRLVAQQSDPSSVCLAVCSGPGPSSTENISLLFFSYNFFSFSKNNIYLI